MTSAGESVAKRHSVFISYASEDREAGRVLRDGLVASGLEVWFDENELGGGDAWDQKIRRQIRDCDYFMPMISATTERRKEGYFRREWRLAVERTMDMADDVLFLLPIVIDDTTQGSARVPDKFLAVQWLRVPGAQMNDALASLCRRMQVGDHRSPPVLSQRNTAPFQTTAPFRTSSTPPVPPPPMALTPPPAVPASHHLPMPPFPPHPEKGGFAHGLKYVAEVCWWVVNAAWTILQRMPKWARIILIIWMVFAFIIRCSRDDQPQRSTSSNRPPRSSNPPPSPEIKRALRKAAEEMARNQKGGSNDVSDPSRYIKAGEKFAQIFASSVEEASEKDLVVVPFPGTAEDTPEGHTLNSIFNAFFGKVMLAQSDNVGLVKRPYSGNTDATLVERGAALDSKFILQATLDTSTEAHALDVRMLKVDGAQLVWSGHYLLANADPNVIADQIADGALGALPKK